MSERARSFETAAAEYELHRPEYPEEALRWLAGRLGLSRGTRVLDLGAGTGKLTRGMLALGLEVVAVEPGAPMLAQLRAPAPGVEALEGSAEAIPLPDASVDAAVAGQAYHWFDAVRAVPELHRVLRPGGGVGLFWNCGTSATRCSGSWGTCSASPAASASGRCPASRTSPSSSG